MALSSSRGPQGASGAVRCREKEYAFGLCSGRKLRQVKAGAGNRAAGGPFYVVVPCGPGNAGLGVGDSGSPGSPWSPAAARPAPSCHMPHSSDRGDRAEAEGRWSAGRDPESSLRPGPPRPVSTRTSVTAVGHEQSSPHPTERQACSAARACPGAGSWLVSSFPCIGQDSPGHVQTEQTQPWRNG